MITSDSFFFSQSEQLAALTARHAVPAIYGFRESALAGGLISYGGRLAESHSWLGVYTGQILTGEKPADLPVQQSTKVEMVINLKAAATIGLEIPPGLITRADDVIEKEWHLLRCMRLFLALFSRSRNGSFRGVADQPRLKPR